ncbi:hypothetical protein [Microcystis aeruginosa]|uniref:hypothetical protein n=1 Tax=Microcystis aeruginosa TaxID=1126 RepID=UPI0002FA9C76|nr:hypothetical protein [Microcystis aeruginosa]
MRQKKLDYRRDRLQSSSHLLSKDYGLANEYKPSPQQTTLPSCPLCLCGSFISHDLP